MRYDSMRARVLCRIAIRVPRIDVIAAKIRAVLADKKRSNHSDPAALQGQSIWKAWRLLSDRRTATRAVWAVTPPPSKLR